MACLVQQLFRQKIGKELDPSIVDVVLFPLLFKQKHGPKELLQDIKLTQSCNEHGLSAIVGRRQYVGGRARHKNISPFAESCLMRRQRRTDMWGSIDILNELRSLKRPLIRNHPPSNPEDQDDWPSEFEDVYLSLQEQPLWPRVHAEKITDDLNFVNDYLEDALNNGKRISWGGDPTRPNNFVAILSTYY